MGTMPRNVLIEKIKTIKIFLANIYSRSLTFQKVVLLASMEAL